MRAESSCPKGSKDPKDNSGRCDSGSDPEWRLNPERLLAHGALDLQIPALPERSRLYHLEPIGAGTPLVESLTGYVTRLAEEHLVSTGVLLSREIGPCLIELGRRKDWQPPRNYPSNHTNLRAIDGTGTTAADWVSALEKMTGHKDLRPLTLLFWKEVLPVRGLLRSVNAWCPLCFEEQQSAYEPLLWAMDAVKVCPRHRLPLRTVCPLCERTMPRIAWYARPGHCRRCRSWLGSNASGQSADTLDLEWEVRSALEVGSLLAGSTGLHEPPGHDRIAEILRRCLNESNYPDGANLARALDLKKITFWHWCTGKKSPQLSRLVDLSHRLGVPLLELLTAEAPRWNFAHMNPDAAPATTRNEQTKPRRPFDREAARQALEAVLTNDEIPPPSVKEVCRRLGYVRKVVERHLPELCRAIVTRYLLHRKQQAQAKREALREEVRCAVRQLHEHGVDPDTQRVARLLSSPASIKDTLVRTELQRVRRSLGLEH